MKPTYYGLAAGMVGLLLVYNYFNVNATGAPIVHSQEAQIDIVKQAAPLPGQPTAPRKPADSQQSKADIASLQRRWQQHHNRADNYQQCVTSPQNPCGFAQSDPKAAFYQASKALQRELHALTALARENPEIALQGYPLAHANLAIPSRDVQLAALSLLEALPPRDDDVMMLQDVLSHSPDPLVISQTLRLLEQHPNHHQQVANTMIGMIQHGGHFAALAATRALPRFLDDQQDPRLTELQQQLPEDSIYRRSLEQSLQEHLSQFRS